MQVEMISFHFIGGCCLRLYLTPVFNHPEHHPSLCPIVPTQSSAVAHSPLHGHLRGSAMGPRVARGEVGATGGALPWLGCHPSPSCRAKPVIDTSPGVPIPASEHLHLWPLPNK